MVLVYLAKGVILAHIDCETGGEVARGADLGRIDGERVTFVRQAISSILPEEHR